MTDRLEPVKRLYEAFASGDGATLQDLLVDTHWVEAAGMPYGGTYRGFGEVAANVFGPIGQDVTGFSAVPDEIIAAGEDRVLSMGTYRGTGSAGPLEAPFAHLWTVRDGQITHFVQFADTHLFRQAVGA
ncbi:MAG: nuclear transport factor 2 family protein [Pseudomonadota bacterium]